MIKTLSGTTNINNAGTLLGSLSLADGANQLHNLAGGTIQAGSAIDLGATGAFVNDGILANASNVGAVRITGAYSQSASGALSVRIDQLTGKADSFSFSGAPVLNGKLSLATLDGAAVKPGSFTLADILSADGGLNTAGLQLDAAKSAILNYALTNDNGKLSLVSTANFTPQGLSGAGSEVGAAFSRLQALGNSMLAGRITTYLVGLDSTAKLEDAYKTIGAGGISIVPMQVLSTAQRSVQTVTDRMDTWRLEAPARSGVWVTPFAANTTGSGLSSHLTGLTVGVDKQLTSRPVLLGAAVSYTDAASALTDPDAYGQGSQYALSLYGIGYMGQAYLSATGLVGAGVTHFMRRLDALDIAMAGAAPVHSTTIGGRIEAGYAIGFGGASARIVPFIAVEPMSVHEGSATEAFTLSQAAQDATLATQDHGVTFHGRTITAAPVSAGVQLDNRWQMDGNVAFAPQLRVAWVHDTSPDREIDRSFAEIPSLLISRTTVPTQIDAAQVQLSGLWSAGEQWSLKTSVDTQLSGPYSTMGGSLSGIWHGGPRWSVKASLDAQTTSQSGSTGGRVNVRYAW